MSKNISNLSGRIGLKDNLFKQISENTLSDSPQDIKEIAKKHNLGVSTLHGAESVSYTHLTLPTILLV